MEIEIEERIYREVRERARAMGSSVERLLRFLVLSFIEESKNDP